MRLRGQKRVPRPPARITACAMSFFSDMNVTPSKREKSPRGSNPRRSNWRYNESVSGTVTRNSDVGSLGCSSMSGNAAGRNQAWPATKGYDNSASCSSPCAAQNNDQLKFRGVAFNRRCAVAIPSLRGEKFASGQQMLVRVRRMQRQRRNFAAARAIEASNLQRLFQMQLPQFAVGIHAAVIVNAIGQIRILLDFANDHARQNGVLRSRFDEIRFSGVHGITHKKIFDSLMRHAFEKILAASPPASIRSTIPRRAPRRQCATFPFCHAHPRLVQTCWRKRRRDEPEWTACPSEKETSPALENPCRCRNEFPANPQASPASFRPAIFPRTAQSPRANPARSAMPRRSVPANWFFPGRAAQASGFPMGVD